MKKIDTHTGCLRIREFQIQSVVGDHFSSPNLEIKKKSGLPPQRYIGLVFFELHRVLPYHKFGIHEFGATV
jgi:hypothetical protein